MKNLLLLSILCLYLHSGLSGQTQVIRESDYPDKIRVACIGNSVTYGNGISDSEKDSYPSLLQKMLGEKYEVRNFGFFLKVQQYASRRFCVDAFGVLFDHGLGHEFDLFKSGGFDQVIDVSQLS